MQTQRNLNMLNVLLLSFLVMSRTQYPLSLSDPYYPFVIIEDELHITEFLVEKVERGIESIRRLVPFHDLKFYKTLKDKFNNGE